MSKSSLSLAVWSLLTSFVFGQSYSNPFCGVATDRDSISISLECAPGAGPISDIILASYGTPTTGSSCSDYAYNSSCNSPNFLGIVTQACVNKSYCTVTMDHSDPDPCVNVIKSIAVVATCAKSPGGYIPGPPPPVVPSCATQNGDPPCPLPQAPWKRTWALNRSTICQPGNTADFLDAYAAAKFGLISLDWSIANGVWKKNPCNESTGAATLVEQCRQIAAVDPTTKCFVYRNTELALEWLEPQRAAMENASMAGYFLQYQPGNPGGVEPGTIYNEDAGGPGSGCKQFFWNYSNADAVAYVLSVSEQGALATDSPFVQGTFLDDSQAIPQEHPNAPTNMGLSPSQLASLQNDTHAFVQLAIDTLAQQGKFIWQGFDGNRGGDPDEVAPGPTAGNCAAYMTEICAPSWQNVPMTIQAGANQSLAAFLVGRGPIGYIGWGWNGGPLPTWNPLFDLNVGVPLELCDTSVAGVFSRKWSEGTATLDCNTFTATLDFSY